MLRMALLLSLVSAPLVRAEDWPGWLGPRRDGATSLVVKPWTAPLNVVWKTKVGDGHSSPIVAHGLVFLHTFDKDKKTEVVEAYDAEKGTLTWTQSYDRGDAKFPFGSGPRGTPLVHDGKLYTFGITGILSCFDAKKGTPIWNVDTAKVYKSPRLIFGASASPIIEGDNVLINVGAKEASLVAFDRSTGKEKWKALSDRPSYSSPVVIGKDSRQAVFLTGENLVGVNPADGTQVWKYPFRDLISESSTTPIVVGDVLFASSITLGSVGLKLKSSGEVEKLWQDPDLTCYFSTPVPVGTEHLYVVTGSKPSFVPKSSKATLQCVDVKTGKTLWKRENVGRYHASLVRTGDNKLLLLEEQGDLVLLQPDAKEYKELARSKICETTWAHPAVAGRFLFVRDNKNLVCVDLGK